MSIPDDAAVSQLYTWKRQKDDLKHPKGLAWKEHKPKEGLGPFVLKNGSHRTERYISSYKYQVVMPYFMNCPLEGNLTIVN